MRGDDVIHLDLADPDDLQTEGGRPLENTWKCNPTPEMPPRVGPLLARLRDMRGPTGSRVGPHNAGEVTALALCVIAEVLAEAAGGDL